MSTALASEIERLIRSSRLPELRDHLGGFRPPEIASALLDLRPGDQVIAFRVLPRKLAAAVFEYLPSAAQRALVKTMGQEDVASLLNHMSPDDRDILQARSAV